jgi:macrolide-specific efflux system membrane fusion protein
VIKKTLVLAAVGAAILLGAGWWLHLGEARTPGPVEAVVAQRGSLSQTVTALGKVEPLEFVDVGAQISGQIEKIHVQPGDRVEAGDLLVEIDATVYEAQVAADRATLRGLEAQLLEQNAMLKLADQRHRRNMQLYQAKAASREELESSAAESEAAKARLAVLEAEIEKARSTLEANEANLGYTQIAAPMAGTVMSLDVRPGQTISARQTTPVLLRLANLDRMSRRPMSASSAPAWRRISRPSASRTGAGRGSCARCCLRPRSSTTWCSTTRCSRWRTPMGGCCRR